ncbi:3-isopropylmalate dehydratase large subunit [Candidatus Micrarchaeota archaeon]|nr:3-isopropylmalate dehydratase large subunit [Candidatus Micrarchaeota archaeon]
MNENLFDKVWNAHAVRQLPNGQTQLFVGLHLIHEVTSPQAFAMLEESNLTVRHPELTVATCDHIVPTDSQRRPFSDALAETMMARLEQNVKKHGIRFFGPESGRQGIVHVIGPELGFTQPGMVICCGDSHTSTHGAFGGIAFGIGTTQVRDVLATQTIAVTKPKVRQIQVDGKLAQGVYAKDVILAIIRKLGVNGGIGYAYEYAGSTVSAMSMEARMSICNMSIEAGARCGYVNPDETTVNYLRGRLFAPPSDAFQEAVVFWKTMASPADADFDDRVSLDASSLEPMVTWGIHPGQSIGISENVPKVFELAESEQSTARQALAHMNLKEGQPIAGTSIDVAFIGSCTNSRISDLREAASVVKGRTVKEGVTALVVPGSQAVAAQAVAQGLDAVFREAGFQWRNAGCSMCLAMNPDQLVGNQVCASSSNRNFIGRQGSPTGRTLLMSPAMVAAAAIEGRVTDVRDYVSEAAVA